MLAFIAQAMPVVWCAMHILCTGITPLVCLNTKGLSEVFSEKPKLTILSSVRNMPCISLVLQNDLCFPLLPFEYLDTVKDRDPTPTLAILKIPAASHCLSGLGLNGQRQCEVHIDTAVNP